MSALPYLVMAIVLQFAGHLADWLRSKGILTTTQVYQEKALYFILHLPLPQNAV
jgi:hypothetical protein